MSNLARTFLTCWHFQMTLTPDSNLSRGSWMCSRACTSNRTTRSCLTGFGMTQTWCCRGRWSSHRHATSSNLLNSRSRTKLWESTKHSKTISLGWASTTTTEPSPSTSDTTRTWCLGTSTWSSSRASSSSTLTTSSWATQTLSSKTTLLGSSTGHAESSEITKSWRKWVTLTKRQTSWKGMLEEARSFQLLLSSIRRMSTSTKSKSSRTSSGRDSPSNLRHQTVAATSARVSWNKYLQTAIS